MGFGFHYCIYFRAKTKKDRNEYSFSLCLSLCVSLLQRFLLLETSFKWRLSRSNHLLLVETVMIFQYIGCNKTGCFCKNLILFWKTKLSDEIYYNYWYVWHSNFSHYYLPELLLVRNFLYYKKMASHKDYESPRDNSDICSNCFVSIFSVFWCFIIFC